MDASLVNPFIEGTLHILDTTALVKVRPDPPFVKSDLASLGEITGCLDISGDVTGSAAVSFSRQSILGIVSAMFGENMTEINEEIQDAVGEISNMIAGHVTTKIGELGKKVKVRLREVKIGQDISIPHSDGCGRVIVLPFRTTCGRVVIEVCCP